MNVAARAGAWSARHRTKAIVGWLLFVVVALVLGSSGVVKLTTPETFNGDSAKAARILSSAGFDRPASESVLVQATRNADIHGAAGQSAITDVARAVESTGRVSNLRTPLQPGGGDMFSTDGRSALVSFDLKGKADTSDKRVHLVLDTVAGVQQRHPGVRMEEFGEASVTKAINDTVGRDFSRAEHLSIPITFMILLLAFGAVVAALVPLGLALTAILAAGGLLALTSHAIHADSTVSSIMLLIGLAVGVDYSLFYIRREREERAKGHSTQASLQAAAATSGHSVFVSGLTVIVAMAGMFFTGQATFAGIAEGAILVVGVAVLGSLTVLPGVLSKLGDNVERGKLPWVRRHVAASRGNGGSRVWSAVLRVVTARPVVAATLAAAALLALAIPAFRLHTAQPNATDLPQTMPIIQTYNRLTHAFPGGPHPAQVVISARDVTARPVQAAIADLRRRALATHMMYEPVTVDVNAARSAAVVNIPIAGDGSDRTSQNAVNLLRSTLVPSTVGSVGTAYVAGPTASSMDFNHQLRSRIPLVFAFVLGMAFLILMWTFRSVTIAATTVVLNLLSVAAAYGVLVAGFQWGWLQHLLHFTSTGAIASFLPLFLFVILFGLSMDYHVFVLSRVREEHLAGYSTREAVRRGVSRSAGVITSAAVIMVAVFATWTTVSEVALKELGFGLATAVLLDATVVRGVLLPAIMSLLGERNWYMPRWLRRVPTDERNQAQPPAWPALPPAEPAWTQTR